MTCQQERQAFEAADQALDSARVVESQAKAAADSTAEDVNAAQAALADAKAANIAANQDLTAATAEKQSAAQTADDAYSAYVACVNGSTLPIDP